MIEWTKKESKEYEWNNKDLYAIIRAINVDAYRCISTYQTLKEAWDIIKITHKSTSMVKKSRLIWLKWDYDLLYIEENYTFYYFYIKFKISWVICPYLSKHQINEITIFGKKLITLKSNKSIILDMLFQKKIKVAFVKSKENINTTYSS